MTARATFLRRWRAGLVVGLAFAGVAQAVEPTLDAAVPPGLRDPWVPPTVAKSAGAGTPSPSGAALRAQVVEKLRASFVRADAEQRGTITREQARAAGLGLVAARFDAIDTARTGRIAFDDFLRFLRAEGADL